MLRRLFHFHENVKLDSSLSFETVEQAVPGDRGGDAEMAQAVQRDGTDRRDRERQPVRVAVEGLGEQNSLLVAYKG